MAEIRGQLDLQLEIFKTLYDMEAIRDFQEEVLGVIGRTSPEARAEIVRNLRARKAVRAAFDIPGAR